MDNNQTIKTIKLSNIITNKDLMGINTSHYQHAVKLKKALNLNHNSSWRILIGHYYINNEKTVFLNNGEVTSIEECKNQSIPYYPIIEVDLENYLSESDKQTVENIHAKQIENKRKADEEELKAYEKKEKDAKFKAKVAEIYADKKKNEKHL